MGLFDDVLAPGKKRESLFADVLKDPGSKVGREILAQADALGLGKRPVLGSSVPVIRAPEQFAPPEETAIERDRRRARGMAGSVFAEDVPTRTLGELVSDTYDRGRIGVRGLASGLVELANTPQHVINLVNSSANGYAQMLGMQARIPMLPSYDWVRGTQAVLDEESKAIREQMTPAAIRQGAEFESVEGVLPTLGYLATNPGEATGQLAEQAPQFLAAGLPGGVPVKLAGAGAFAGGQTGAQVGAENQARVKRGEITQAQADALTAQGVAGSAIVNSILPKIIPGGTVLEDALAGNKTGLTRGRGAALGLLGEGLTGGAEEAADQALQNEATGRPVGEGVGKAFALGALLEGPVGAGAGFLSSGKPRTLGEIPPEELGAAARAAAPKADAPQTSAIDPAILAAGNEALARAAKNAPRAAKNAPPAPAPRDPAVAPEPTDDIDALLARNLPPDELPPAAPASASPSSEDAGAAATPEIDWQAAADALGLPTPSAQNPAASTAQPAEPAAQPVSDDARWRRPTNGQANPVEGGGLAGAGTAAAGAAEQASAAAGGDQAGAVDAPTMQNRDRSRAASVLQMQQIRKNPDPERLGFSRDPNTGAPMVGAGKAIPDADKGRADTVVMASGRRVPVQYAVVEADELAASHDADGRVNPGYDSAPLKALNNGRTAGLQAAYASGNTDAYRRGIAADAALHGVSAEAIAGKRKPVLVRLYDPAQNTGDMGAESNATQQLGLSPVEQAQTDARALPDLSGMTWNEDGSISPTGNANFFRAWFANLGGTQAASLQDAQGRPNAAAIQRVRAAMVQRAYGDERLLTAMAEEVNPDNRNVMNALVQAAPAFAKLDANALNGEIRSALVGGLEMLRDASARGLSLRDAIAQGDLLGRNADADAVARFMADNARSARRMADAFKEMAAYAADAEAQAATLDVFGTAPTPTVTGALNRAGVSNDRIAEPVGRVAEGRESWQQAEGGRAAAGDAFTLTQQRAPAEQAAAPEEVGLFAPPTAQERNRAAQQQKDASRNGQDATGRTDMMAGGGELFAGPRPAQADVETGALPAQDVSEYGETRPLQLGEERGGAAASRPDAPGRRSAPAIRNQLDLFIATRNEQPPGQGHAPAVKIDRTKLSQSVGLAQIGQFRSGHAVVDSLEKAAHILAPLRKSAQEQFLALVLDDAGKPLGVIRHTVGTIDSSLVEPGVVFSAIASIPGARRVVFAHNHPSGNIDPSAADLAVDRRINALLRGSGIESVGAIIVAPGRREFTAYGDESTALTPTQKIAAAGKTVAQVPSLERRLTKIGKRLAGAMSSPAEAARMAEREAAGKYPSGVILLDTRHHVIGIFGMSRKDMSPLRTGDAKSGIADLARRVHGANAAAAFVYGPEEIYSELKNLGRAINALGVRTLDTFIIGDDGKATSLAEKGQQPSMGDTAFESVDGLTVKEDAQPTEAEAAAFDRQAVDKKGLAGKVDRQKGQRDAEASGLAGTAGKLLGAVNVDLVFARTEAGLEGLVTPGYMSQLRDQQKGRKPGRFTAGLYIPANRSANGKPFAVVFTGNKLSPALQLFTAAHEIAGHHGLRALLGDRLNKVLDLAEQNPTVRAVAASMTRQRNLRPDQRYLAIEEALADLAAAVRTKNFQRIADKHGVEVPKSMQSKLRAMLDNIVARIKALFGKQGVAFTDAQVLALLENAWQAARNGGEAAIGKPDALESTDDQTQSEAFKRWFGDSVVTENGKAGGKPLVVYHGTSLKNIAGILKNGLVPRKKKNHQESGDYVYVELSAKTARAWARQAGGTEFAVLEIEVPESQLVRDSQTLSRTSFRTERIPARLIKGWDVYRIDPRTGDLEYVRSESNPAFRPEQIKSATDNRGTFDPSNPSILESVEYTPEQEAALTKAGLQVDRRTSLQRTADSLREKWRSVRDTLRDAEAMKQAAFDRFHGLRHAEARLGLNDPEVSAYIAARMSAGLDAVMEAMLSFGAPVWDGGVLAIKDGTVGLLDALKPVEGMVDEWLGWMVGRRAKLLKSQGRENNLTDDDIAALLSLADGREQAFQQAARDYLKIKNAVLDVAEQAGLIDPSARAVWDHAEYIPFYRAEGDGSVGPGTRKGLQGQTSGIRTLKGGDQALADPLANIIRNFTKLVDASMKNRAVLLAVDNYGNQVFEKVGMDMAQALVPLDQVKKHLREQGTPESVINALPAGTLKGVQRMLSIVPPSAEDVVRVMRDGKAEYYRVKDPLVLRALTAFKQPDKNIAIKPFIWFKRLLTTGVTATPEFIVANFIRDSGSAWVISDDRFKPGWDSMRGVVSTLRNDQTAREMMMAGSTFLGGQFYDGNPDKAASAIRRALRSKGMSNRDIEGFIGTIASTPLKLWDGYLKLSGAVENANRRAVFDAAIKAGRTRTEAAYMARDLMDFAMQGDAAWVQLFSDILPFFNARLQGLYKLGRRAGTKQGKRAILLRGGVITLATVALYAWNLLAHSDGWDELEEWDKDAYWHVAPGTPYHIRIPKPFELGLLFGTAPERGMEAIRNRINQAEGDKPETTLDALIRAITGTLAFNPVPQAALPIAEQWANKRFFTGRPIEDMGDEKLLPEDRKEWYTSDTMKALGRMSGISPKRLEHIWNGYTAGMGAYVLDASDAAVRYLEDAPERPALNLSEWPVLGRFARGGAPGRTKYGTQFYDRLRKAEQVEQSIKSRLEAGDEAGALKLERENAGLLGERIPSKRAKEGFLYAKPRAMRKVRGELSAIRDEIEAIATSRNVSAEEKRQQINALEERRNKVFRDAVKSAEQ